jgi:predicted nucleotidyltransferase
MTMKTLSEYLDLLRRFKEEQGVEYGITGMGIFGSVVRGQHIQGSDIDVLVEAPVLSLITRITIMRQLEEALGVPVDVVRKTKYMPPRFKTRLEKEVVYV